MSKPDQSNTGRLPPFSAEAEQGVLGCIMLDPVESMGRCLEKLQGGSASFYDKRHQVIFDVMQAMDASNLPIDVITLQQRLSDASQLEAAGGLSYLASLPDAVPSAANLAHYLDIISEKYTHRRVIDVCSKAIARVYDRPDEAGSLLDDVERDILAIGDQRDMGSEATGKDLARSFTSDFEAQARGEHKAVSTGFWNLDNTLRGGLKPGQLFVIAARPGMGKSAFAERITTSIASAGTPVGIFSLEMSQQEWTERIVSSLSGVDVGKFVGCKPEGAESEAILAAHRKLARLPLWIDASPGRTVAQMQAIARRWKARNGVGVIGIDYLQYIEAGRGSGKDRREQVDAISRGLKLMAKELQLPVIVLAQLNRNIENEKGRKPRLSDLRESGGIEQNADIAAFLYNPNSADDKEPSPYEKREVRLLVSKNRKGPQGADLRFTFDPTITRFDQFSPISRDA